MKEQISQCNEGTKEVYKTVQMLDGEVKTNKAVQAIIHPEDQNNLIETLKKQNIVEQIINQIDQRVFEIMDKEDRQFFDEKLIEINELQFNPLDSSESKVQGEIMYRVQGLQAIVSKYYQQLEAIKPRQLSLQVSTLKTIINEIKASKNVLFQFSVRRPICTDQIIFKIQISSTLSSPNSNSQNDKTKTISNSEYLKKEGQQTMKEGECVHVYPVFIERSQFNDAIVIISIPDFDVQQQYIQDQNNWNVHIQLIKDSTTYQNVSENYQKSVHIQLLPRQQILQNDQKDILNSDKKNIITSNQSSSQNQSNKEDTNNQSNIKSSEKDLNNQSNFNSTQNQKQTETVNIDSSNNQIKDDQADNTEQKKEDTKDNVVNKENQQNKIHDEKKDLHDNQIKNDHQENENNKDHQENTQNKDSEESKVKDQTVNDGIQSDDTSKQQNQQNENEEQINTNSKKEEEDNKQELRDSENKPNKRMLFAQSFGREEQHGHKEFSSKEFVEMQQQMMNNEKCQIFGHFYVKKVPGNFHFSFHNEGLLTLYFNQIFNLRHTINTLEITSEDGKLSLGKYSKSSNPLDRTHHNPGHGVDNDYYLKIVNTIYENILSNHTNIYSFTSLETVGRRDFRLPAVNFRYEFDPITVLHYRKSRSISQFIVTLCAIIGGSIAISKYIHILIVK